MTKREVEEYKVRAVVHGIRWFVSKLTTNFMCQRFPYFGCYQKADEITGKAATDFWTAFGQAIIANASRR